MLWVSLAFSALVVQLRLFMTTAVVLSMNKVCVIARAACVLCNAPRGHI